MLAPTCGRKQRASGDVTLQVVKGSNHCGINEDSLDLHYEIQMEFECDSLDKHGFLLDNTAFRGYFTAMSTVPISLSCEDLAGKIADDIRAMLGDRRDKLTYICVELVPFEGVSVSYEWPKRTHLEPFNLNPFTDESL